MIFLDTQVDPRPLVPLLMEAGNNCLYPLECAANVDAVALRHEYGRGPLLWGGIDKRALAKSKRDIEREVTTKLPPLLNDGGYIPPVDHLVPPYENWLHYLEVKKRLPEGREA